ncbi:DUF4249 domain-containing protein [Ekhidna sp.]|jgi:hypothetical protein|uniref:DUF4249 domain-containing protein n=1 Tax=Ekhidna sp. TaxID=2608089 RepID=UPI0032EF5E43
MKKLLKYLIPVIAVACNTDIAVDLQEAEAPLVVDAFIYHKAEPQVIDLTIANTYFDSSEPIGISGANVIIHDVEADMDYIFSEESAGKYVWNPTNPSDSFGIVGNTYVLSIDNNGSTYSSTSRLNRVVPVDSITWRLEEEEPFTEGDYYVGEFWATDAPGAGDAYWIKAWKNGVLLNQPGEINLAIDGAFSDGDNADNVTFITPIRQAVTPFEFDDEDVLIDPFELGDSLYVEIQSITPEVHFFLQSAIEQTDREGGFGELFATPLANLPTNIFPEDPSEQVVGIFCMSAAKGLGRKFTEDAILDEEE